MPPEAAATPAPAAAEAPPPVEPNGALAEDDQIVEDLRKEAFAKRDEEPEPAAAKPVTKAKDKTAKPTLAIVKYGTPEAAVEAICKALEAGDMDALAKATGKPKSMFALSDSKWGAFRAQKAQVAEQEKSVKQGMAALAEGRKAAQEEYGPAILAARAYKDGDLEQFVTLVAVLTGEDYAISQKRVIEGVLAADPNVKKLRQQNALLEKRLAQLEKPQPPPAPAEPTQQDRQDAYNRVLASLEDELSGQPITRVRGYQNLVLEKVRDSFDQVANSYTLGFAEAAEQVMEERREEATALGLVSAPRAPRQLPAPAPAVPPRGRAADARAPEAEPWMTEDVDDDAIIASLERDRKAGRLR